MSDEFVSVLMAIKLQKGLQFKSSFSLEGLPSEFCYWSPCFQKGLKILKYHNCDETS